MAWTTGYVHQSGNTTVTWAITGDALSTHDCVVVRYYSGRSGIRIKSITVYRYPKRYLVTTQVIGNTSVVFKFSAEKMN